MFLLRLTSAFTIVVLTFLTVYVDSTDVTPVDEIFASNILKWSRDVGAHFKAGFPNENVSSIDPYDAEHVIVKGDLGLYKNVELTIEVDGFSIKGLGNRKVVNASTSHVFMNQFRTHSYVTYNDIVLEGKYAIYHESSNPVVANVTGRFSYNLVGKMFVETSYFNRLGTQQQGQAPKYEFIEQSVNHPDYYSKIIPGQLPKMFYGGSFTLSHVPVELDAFVRSARITQRIDHMSHYLIFQRKKMIKARENVCKYSWSIET